ncbi:MAG: hypothetical protein EBT92_19025 [Planctomycetes bacterium]|nr:hypothetical protein [Planctomycetota bacterium]NBY03095.1 hypothetical protein [Planctomycetota bacterium]
MHRNKPAAISQIIQQTLIIFSRQTMAFLITGNHLINYKLGTILWSFPFFSSGKVAISILNFLDTSTTILKLIRIKNY